MAMYVPLFAALSAQYAAANEDAPRLIALDEAFAGDSPAWERQLKQLRKNSLRDILTV